MVKLLIPIPVILELVQVIVCLVVDLKRGIVKLY